MNLKSRAVPYLQNYSSDSRDAEQDAGIDPPSQTLRRIAPGRSSSISISDSDSGSEDQEPLMT